MGYISIIDYGMGNLSSVANAILKAGFQAKTTSEKKCIIKSEGVILPGVGSFHRAMKNLRHTGLSGVIREVIAEGKPFLGICLGHQLLFTESDEGGKPCKGFNVIEGVVRKFPDGLKVPQMGWNTLDITRRENIIEGVKRPLFMYFAHSYYAEAREKSLVVARTRYGIVFDSMVSFKNVIGMQPHPEKSGEAGLKILKNFCGMCVEKKQGKRDKHAHEEDNTVPGR